MFFWKRKKKDEKIVVPDINEEIIAPPKKEKKKSLPTQLLMDEAKHVKYADMCNGCGKENCDPCPVGLKKKGDIALAGDDAKRAIQYYIRAVELAPDYAELWTNLGSAYGQNGDLEKAVMAFDNAISIDNVYGMAMYGKAISLEKMGNYIEADKVYDEILSLYDVDFVKKNKKGLKAKIDELHKFEDGPVNEMKQSITDALVTLGKIHNAIGEGMINIPDLSLRAYDYASKCVHALDEDEKDAQTMLAWCFYGGMAASVYWKNYWHILSKNDLFDMLTREKGLTYLDEVVYDIVGIVSGTVDDNNIKYHLKDYTDAVIKIVTEVVRGMAKEGALKMVSYAGEVMFLFGVTYQLRRMDVR